MFHYSRAEAQRPARLHFSEKMTLHPHITHAELDAYTTLAWEHHIRRVKVDEKTYNAIHRILKTDTHHGIKYITTP